MMDTDNLSLLDRHLKYLKLPFMREQHHCLAEQAAKNGWSHEDYLEKLADGEAALRKDRSIQRRIRMARFPVIKTLDQFNWTWPKKSTGFRYSSCSGCNVSSRHPTSSF
jgi:DNA replication protein DnaC